MKAKLWLESGGKNSELNDFESVQQNINQIQKQKQIFYF